MCKECRTVTIKKILEEFEKEKREEIISTFNSSMIGICAGDVDWQNFEVFLPGIELMRVILESLMPEYLMAITDQILSQGANTECVRIIVKRSTKSDFDVFKCDGNIMATVSIAKKVFKKLVSKI